MASSKQTLPADRRGYFALYRKFQDHKFWKEKRIFSKAEAWIDILWEAQHQKEPQEVLLGMKLLICNYGETLKSISTWAKRWGWSRPKVDRFLRLCVSMDQIETVNEIITTRVKVINYKRYDLRKTGHMDESWMNPGCKKNETDSETVTTGVSGLNYGIYGQNDLDSVQQSCRNRAGIVQESCTDKNVKNIKNKDICPQQSILDLYHEILPDCIHHKKWVGHKKRMGKLNARWKDKLPSTTCPWHSGQIKYWENLFKYISKNDFLMGRTHPFWQGFSLDWLVIEDNFLKTTEGKYSNNLLQKGSVTND